MSAIRVQSIWACVLVLSAGCGGDESGVGKTFPVTGKITIGNEPLSAPSAIVLFKPDASKGNTSGFEPVGNVNVDGNYALKTKGKEGAPPGWYKVVVTAHDGKMRIPEEPHKRPAPTSLVPAKYGNAQTTDLAVQVVESPAAGAYDLKLAK